MASQVPTIEKTDPADVMSIRKYQALRATLLISEVPDILGNYMELVVQFGYIILFGTVFPLGAAVSYLSNHVQIISQLSALNFTRRARAESCIGIGSWMDCISSLTQISIITNSA